MLQNCICLELVLDVKGEKMSKSKGMSSSRWMCQTDGADALRWYVILRPARQRAAFDTKMVADITRR